MKLSKKGLEMIKSFEGFCATATKCVSTEKYYTIGYGHYGVDVKKGDTITQEKALELLKKDVSKFECKVDKYNHIYQFNQNEFDALISFAYNVGSIDKLTANGTRTREKIAECILRYNKSGGRVLTGLTNRRKKEQELFLTKQTSYYKKYNGGSTSVDSVLRVCGVDEKYLGSWTSRKPLALANNIHNYVGSRKQNERLLVLAKKGKLKRV